MKTPKISIIVPVYQVEPYIRRCIDSILSQTFKDFELILVDDGSPDKCGEICDEYALKDSRIKVIHKKNGGLSSARNAGLDIAQGDYIGFVDSDDWIDEDMYEVLYENITKYNVEVAVCGIRTIRNNKNEFKKELKEEKIKKILLNSKEEVLNQFYRKGEIGASTCNKLYGKNIINSVRFLEGHLYEDIVFNVEIFNKIERSIIIDKKLYNYFCLNESITRSKVNIKTVTAVKNAVYSYYKTDPKYKDDPLYSIAFTSLWICKMIVNEKTTLKNRETLYQLKLVLKENKELIKKIPFKSKREEIMFKFLKINPFIFCVFYRSGKEIKNLLRGRR